MHLHTPCVSRPLRISAGSLVRRRVRFHLRGSSKSVPSSSETAVFLTLTTPHPSQSFQAFAACEFGRHSSCAWISHSWSEIFVLVLGLLLLVCSYWTRWLANGCNPQQTLQCCGAALQPLKCLAVLFLSACIKWSARKMLARRCGMRCALLTKLMQMCSRLGSPQNDLKIIWKLNEGLIHVWLRWPCHFKYYKSGQYCIKAINRYCIKQILQYYCLCTTWWNINMVLTSFIKQDNRYLFSNHFHGITFRGCICD